VWRERLTKCFIGIHIGDIDGDACDTSIPRAALVAGVEASEDLGPTESELTNAEGGQSPASKSWGGKYVYANMALIRLL
jgi:hypothetical protein